MALILLLRIVSIVKEMNAQEILYYSLSAASIVIAASLIYGVYYLVQTLKEIQLVLDDIKDTTNDIQSIKNTIKLGLLNIGEKFLGKLSGRR